MSVISLNESNFDEVIGSSTPVLVDFYAPWCGSCRTLAPVIEQLGAESGELSVAKVNIDEAAELAHRFDIASVPTLALFRDGELCHRRVGAVSRNELISFLNNGGIDKA